MDKMILQQQLRAFGKTPPDNDRDFYALLKLAAYCACFHPLPQNRRLP